MTKKRSSTVPGIYSEIEEEFFRSAEQPSSGSDAAESFDDLDVGYRPVGFWKRLFGGGRRR